MLKNQPIEIELVGRDQAHFFKEHVYLMVTNSCDVACGGCNQFCPNFASDQIFFLSLEEITNGIEFLRPYRNEIWITGGEPLMHPKWSEVLALLYSYSQIRFTVFTKYHNVPEKNVCYKVDFKDPRTSNRRYHPTLVAPIDVFPNQTQVSCWDMAKQYCYSWMRCPAALYRGKFYFCEVAGGMDILFGENHGWEIKEGVNPFDRTDEEIAEEAYAFCYRCGRCFSAMLPREKGKFGVRNQSISIPSLVSVTNWNSLKQYHYVRLLDRKLHTLVI